MRQIKLEFCDKEERKEKKLVIIGPSTKWKFCKKISRTRNGLATVGWVCFGFLAK